MRDEPQRADPVQPSGSPPIPDRWYCQVDRIEYGPFRFQFLVDMVAYGRMQLKANDCVKHGRETIWRRAEDFAEIMAAIKYYEQSAQTTTTSPADRPKSDSVVNSPLLDHIKDTISGWWEGLYECLSWRPADISRPDFGWSLRPFTAMIRGVRYIQLLCSRIGLSVFGVIGILFWITVNVLALSLPNEMEVIGTFLAKSLSLPTTWFILFSIAAFIIAARLNSNG